MEKNAINTNGLTALDIHIRSKKSTSDSEIWVSLKRAKALKAKKALKPRNRHQAWIENKRNALMIIASLIATIAFQVGIHPPGGTWQDDNGHVAGVSIMADISQELYDALITCNTIGLVTSMTVIFLLISGLPCTKLCVWTLMIMLWASVSATTLSYVVSVNYLTGEMDFFQSKKYPAISIALFATVLVWLVWLVVLLLGHGMRTIAKIIRRLFYLGARLYYGSLSFAKMRAT